MIRSVVVLPQPDGPIRQVKVSRHELEGEVADDRDVAAGRPLKGLRVDPDRVGCRHLALMPRLLLRRKAHEPSFSTDQNVPGDMVVALPTSSSPPSFTSAS